MTTNLRARRRERDLTQIELADLLNTTQQALSAWERGERMPRKPMRKRLAAVFGVPIDVLMAPETTTTAASEETTAAANPLSAPTTSASTTTREAGNRVHGS